MSADLMRRALSSALLLVTLGSSSAALACPQGESKVCLISCFCVPGTPEQVGPLYDRLSQMAASGLQAWLEKSHRTAAAGPLQIIPLHIRAQLEPYYSLQVLDSVRFKVGDDTELNAANTMLQNPDVNAVTMLDIIVFRHEEDAQNNVALWAHELKHVEQYQQWGAAEFALRYVRDYTQVEAPAYGIQSQVNRELRLSSGMGR